MRFEGWDVMLFPLGSTATSNGGPVQEFRVQCHVIPDLEFARSNGSLGVPIVSSFIPSLPPGTPFKISIHSWSTPEISRYSRAYSRHLELVKIEARVFIDGRLVSSCSLDRHHGWPQDIIHTFELTKNGDLELLRFPHFRRELLTQQIWGPGDDIGRIKVILSEGFPRDSLTTPVERVKNIVAFSFQHAPLDVLENVEIAWPNQAMWTRRHAAASTVPTYHHTDGPSSHAHSPRRRPRLLHSMSEQFASFTPTTDGFAATDASPPNLTLMQPPGAGIHGNIMAPPNGGNDTLTEAVMYNAWLGHTTIASNSVPGTRPPCPSQRWKPQTGFDTAMLGSPLPTIANQGSLGSRDIVSSTRSEGALSLNQLVSQCDADSSMFEDEILSEHARAPTNTPTSRHGALEERFPSMPANSVLPTDLAVNLTNSLLNQPMPLSIQSHSHHLSASRPSSIARSRTDNMIKEGLYINPHQSSDAAHMASPPRLRSSGSSCHVSSGMGIPGTGMAVGTLSSQSSFNLSRELQDLVNGSSPATFSSVSQDELAMISNAASTPNSGRTMLKITDNPSKNPTTQAPRSTNPFDRDGDLSRQSPMLPRSPFLAHNFAQMA